MDESRRRLTELANFLRGPQASAFTGDMCDTAGLAIERYLSSDCATLDEAFGLAPTKKVGRPAGTPRAGGISDSELYAAYWAARGLLANPLDKRSRTAKIFQTLNKHGFFNKGRDARRPNVARLVERFEKRIQARDTELGRRLGVEIAKQMLTEIPLSTEPSSQGAMPEFNGEHWVGPGAESLNRAPRKG